MQTHAQIVYSVCTSKCSMYSGTPAVQVSVCKTDDSIRVVGILFEFMKILLLSYLNCRWFPGVNEVPL